MDENQHNTTLMYNMREDVTRLITLMEVQKTSDLQMHQSILDTMQGLEKLMNEKTKTHEKRITKLEENQARIAWLVISIVATAVIGVVIYFPRM